MVIKALDPYWSTTSYSGSGSGSVKNDYGSTTLIFINSMIDELNSKWVLFLIYINDLPKSSNLFSLLFADDTTMEEDGAAGHIGSLPCGACSVRAKSSDVSQCVTLGTRRLCSRQRVCT